MLEPIVRSSNKHKNQCDIIDYMYIPTEILTIINVKYRFVQGCNYKCHTYVMCNIFSFYFHYQEHEPKDSMFRASGCLLIDAVGIVVDSKARKSNNG